MSGKNQVNWKMLGVGLALVAGLVALFASGFGKDPRAIPSMLEGRPATLFAVEDLDGAPVSLEALRGTPVILNFWSTWCQPCKIEHPFLQDAARAFPDVKFYGVLYGDEPQKARRFLQQQGSAYPILVDPGGRMAIDYGVTGVPETFFIDRNGVIAAKFSGPVPPDELQRLIGVLRKP
jgi:cytochrome c biogenesis protein CcmG/thiol:disulfide interchange protein DsbE